MTIRILITLDSSTADRLGRAAVRTGLSRAAVAGALIDLYADALRPEILPAGAVAAHARGVRGRGRRKKNLDNSAKKP